MKLFWQCLFSPRLYKIYRDGPRDNMYTPQGMELLADKVITSVNALMSITFYTSPFICMYFYRRGLNYEEIKFMMRLCAGLSCMVTCAFIVRAYGRACNAKYVQFIEALNAPMTDKRVYLEGIRNFDFDFKAWPVTYSVTSKDRSTTFRVNPFTKCSITDLPIYQRFPLQVLAFIATHTFGIRLIYPGVLTLVQNLFWSSLFQGRTQLVEGSGGKRAKLLAADGNNIETMYVQNKQSLPNSKILVICCEGNTGFYELGIMGTPIRAGYSALGWNHPGFSGSTGKPFPSQEHNAMDAVMDYAMNELGYHPRDIVLFGWSIGGYTASWAAINYPIKALILDATFDDLLPLAQKQMPSSWSTLVKEVVRTYVNLNVADLLTKYDGPVQLIRRIDDEVICTTPGDRSTNCCNKIVVKLAESRNEDLFSKHPGLKDMIIKYVPLTDSQRNLLERTEIEETDKLALQLIGKYLNDYNATHCIPLSDYLFNRAMDKMDASSL